MSKTIDRIVRSLRFLSLFGLAAASLPVFAQQLYMLSGITKELPTNEDSFAWAVDYSEPLGKIFSYSLAYVNEGHLMDHHRDGVAAQFWAGFNLTPRWSIKVGAGPYLYFDTAAKQTAAGYADDHGVGVITSLATTWQVSEHWGVQLRANRILTSPSIDTTSIVLGVGYQFDAATLPGSSSGEAAWRSSGARVNEAAIFLGRTYVNNFESETATAYGIEYRRNLSRHLDWTVGAMHEGNPGPLNRRGIVSEIWLTRAACHDRASFGVGIGPYLAFDSKDDNRTRVSAVLTLTASYRLTDTWAVRATWHRVATDYSHDSDVILVGAGYRW